MESVFNVIPLVVHALDQMKINAPAAKIEI